MDTSVLLVYIVLLLVGGYLGFAKAGSKVSLITSAVSAALLLLFLFAPIPFAAEAIYVVLGLLLIAFIMRLKKTRKFMPSGLLCALTAVTLLLVILF
ncbi:MAG: TMEM14 family protein [Verrucomicrobiae bacterium]|nr:TMEM14 family protein [Verrucomicrobiae bacterium]